MNYKTEQHLSQGYEVKIGDYISRGFDIFKANIGGYLGFFVLYLIIAFVLNFIPFVNIVSGILITPCLVFGFHLVSNHIAQYGVEPPFGDYFNGFNYFSKIVVVNLLIGLSILVCLAPAFASMLTTGLLANLDDPEAILEIFSGGNMGLFILGFLGVIFLSVSWVFASMVAVFQNVDAWGAMEISRKMVAKNWFGVFAFLVVIAVITLAGAFLFLIGLLFTVPLGYCCIYAAYEDIFGNDADNAMEIEGEDDISSIGGDLLS